MGSLAAQTGNGNGLGNETRPWVRYDNLWPDTARLFSVWPRETRQDTTRDINYRKFT